MLEKQEELTTRERLIEAAGELFAEKGFKETTVRDICERAGANVAAVNYYYGDKEKLYLEVIRHIAREAFRKFPLEEDPDCANDCGRRLYRFVYTLMMRMHDPEKPTWHGILFSEERFEQDSNIHSIFEPEVLKSKKILDSIVSDLLGDCAEPERVSMCFSSIIGQIVFHSRIRRRQGPPFLREGPMSREKIEAVAKHITEFSISGIERIKSQSKASR